MITQSVTNVIDCSTTEEYEAAKSRIAMITLPLDASVTYDPANQRITITVTKTADKL